MSQAILLGWPGNFWLVVSIVAILLAYVAGTVRSNNRYGA